MNRTSVVMATIGALAAGISPARAQTRLELGVKGGALFSKASVEDDSGVDLSTLTSFGGGVFLGIPVGRIVLQPELLYMRKGVSVSGEDLGDATLDVKLDYVEIPLLLKVPFGTGEGAAPYVFGGGAIAFETSCKFDAESSVLSFNVDCDNAQQYDLELERKSTDYGAVFGAGLRIPFGTAALLLEGRYTLGLADLNDSGNSGEGFKNRAAAAFVGFSFNVGR